MFEWLLKPLFFALKLYSAILNKSRALRYFTVFLSTLSLIVATAIMIIQSTGWPVSLKYSSHNLTVAMIILSVLSISGYLLVIFSTLSTTVMQSIWKQIEGHVSIELEPIRTERREIQDRIAQQENANIFDTIQLNLNQLNEYYTINKTQARRSFTASLFAIVAGLVMIIITIAVPMSSGEGIQSKAYIGAVSGVILQFIGGAYFYLYNRSLSQLNFFFDRLSVTQETMLAIKLCESLPEAQDKSEMLSRVILSLMSHDHFSSKRAITGAKSERGKRSVRQERAKIPPLQQVS